jgi:hypothetical protein
MRPVTNNKPDHAVDPKQDQEVLSNSTEDHQEEQEVISISSDLEEEDLEELEEAEELMSISSNLDAGDVPSTEWVKPPKFKNADWSFFVQLPAWEDWPEWAGVELSRGEMDFNRDMFYSATLGEVAYNKWLESSKTTVADMNIE